MIAQRSGGFTRFASLGVIAGILVITTLLRWCWARKKMRVAIERSLRICLIRAVDGTACLTSTNAALVLPHVGGEEFEQI